jgi:hypothetical protein
MPKVKFTGSMGTTTNQRPISTKYPPAIDEILRGMTDKSDYIRKAVIEKMYKDKLLSEEIANNLQNIGLLDRL